MTWITSTNEYVDECEIREKMDISKILKKYPRASSTDKNKQFCVLCCQPWKTTKKMDE